MAYRVNVLDVDGFKKHHLDSYLGLKDKGIIFSESIYSPKNTKEEILEKAHTIEEKKSIYKCLKNIFIHNKDSENVKTPDIVIFEPYYMAWECGALKDICGPDGCKTISDEKGIETYKEFLDYISHELADKEIQLLVWTIGCYKDILKPLDELGLEYFKAIESSSLHNISQRLKEISSLKTTESVQNSLPQQI